MSVFKGFLSSLAEVTFLWVDSYVHTFDFSLQRAKSASLKPCFKGTFTCPRGDLWPIVMGIWVPLTIALLSLNSLTFEHIFAKRTKPVF